MTSAAVLILVLAGRAEAAELTFFEFGGILQYAAGEGEQNRLTVERPDPTTIVFRDAGAAVQSGPGCSAVDEGAVSCTVGETTIIRVTLRDGDDEASAPATIAVNGGAGNDRLSGCHLEGGDGDDVLIACGRGAALFGDAGDDVLLGGPAADRLHGSRGRDRLLGGGGDDVLDDDIDHRRLPAESGDELDGGAGNDDLLVRDLFADRPRCVGRSVAVRPSGYALATVRCPRRSEVFGNCAGIATVYARIGNRTVRVGRGRCTICDRVLGVRLDRRGRAALRRRGRLRARVTFRRVDPGRGMLRHAEKTTFRPARGAR